MHFQWNFLKTRKFLPFDLKMPILKWNYNPKRTSIGALKCVFTVKSIFYKNDIRISKVSKIPLFLPRYFVNKGKGTNTFKATIQYININYFMKLVMHFYRKFVNHTGCVTSTVPLFWAYILGSITFKNWDWEVFDVLCFQKTGAEIGEFLTPLISLCHSYKKWTLVTFYEKSYLEGESSLAIPDSVLVNQAWKWSRSLRNRWRSPASSSFASLTWSMAVNCSQDWRNLVMRSMTTSAYEKI